MMAVPLTIVLFGGIWPPVGVACEPVVASWYGDAFAGSPTASGEPFSPDGMTAAHKTLPFGTVLDVAGPDGTVTVEVTDRGPFVAGRDLDLSESAFGEVAPLGAGVVDVQACVHVDRRSATVDRNLRPPRTR